MITWAKSDITSAANDLRDEFGFDFVAIGLSAEHGAPLRWLYESGAQSDSYARISLNPGRGVGGIVLRAARPMFFTDIDAQMDPREFSSYPIVFAEGIRAFCALPLFLDFECTGVLLCAFRSAQSFHKHVFIRLFEELSDGFVGYALSFEGLQQALTVDDVAHMFVKPVDSSAFAEEDFPQNTSAPEIDPYAALSFRELEVFTLLARGYTNKEISAKLFLSVKTVEAHRARIYQKLAIETRAQLVSLAIRHQLLVV